MELTLEYRDIPEVREALKLRESSVIRTGVSIQAGDLELIFDFDDILNQKDKIELQNLRVSKIIVKLPDLTLYGIPVEWV